MKHFNNLCDKINDESSNGLRNVNEVIRKHIFKPDVSKTKKL